VKPTLSLIVLGVVALAGCKAIPPATPLAQLNPQQAHGHVVFQARCGGCHADRNDDALIGPALNGIFKKEYLSSGAPANDAMVMGTIQRGRNMMPPMGRTMDPEQLDDLMAYLHTL
jgi:mono/diheme cytochrome c family protein